MVQIHLGPWPSCSQVDSRQHQCGQAPPHLILFISLLCHRFPGESITDRNSLRIRGCGVVKLYCRRTASPANQEQQFGRFSMPWKGIPVQVDRSLWLSRNVARGLGYRRTTSRQHLIPRGSGVPGPIDEVQMQGIKIPRQDYMERMGLRNRTEALSSPRRSASETSGLDASWNRQEKTRDTVLQRKKHADAAAAAGTRPFLFLIAAFLKNGAGCRSHGRHENSLIKCHIDYLTFVFSFESWKQWMKVFEVLAGAGKFTFKTDPSKHWYIYHSP